MQTKKPTKLRNSKDIQDWNEYMMLSASDGKISPVQLNGMNKVIDATIKINMKIPLEYTKVIARSGKNGLSVQVPWIEDVINRTSTD